MTDSSPPPPPAPPPYQPPPPDKGPSLRVILIAAGLIVAVVVVLVMVLSKPQIVAKSRAIGARLDLAAGEVTVTEGKVSDKALSGAPLASGSHIATGKGSRALVRTGDGAAVFLRGESEVALAENGIELVRGEIWLDAPKVEGDSTSCKAGPHTISASDAGLSIKLTGTDVTVYVARSLAILTSPGGRVEIGAGTQGTAQAAGAPKLQPVAFWQDWTGGMGDARPAHGSVGSGAGRIYGVDQNARPGAPARKLGIAKQVVRAVLRDGIAETEVDQTFSNPGGNAIEGWYWFTLPLDASVTSFALETNGQLVEGEIVEKKEAAAKYEAAKRTGYDPALLEWVDGRSFRARIFPIPANGTRRVVLRYVELLPVVDGKTRFVYPLRAEDPIRFDEFAMSVDLGATGAEMDLATSLDATVEEGGKRVTMRRSGFVPRADFQLEMSQKKKTATPVRAWRFEAGSDQADYVMLRYVPDVDFTKLPAPKGELVVVVDTSAGGDESARSLRTAAAEAILRALSDDDRFAVVALDVKPTVVYPEKGLAQATDGDIAKALERLSEHTVGGASDLGAMFEPSLERLHGAEQPAIVYVGDGIATSGESSPDALVDRLRRSLSGSRARLFTVDVGADAHHDVLEQLARVGGGQHVRIDEPEETTGQALRLTSAVKTPTITDLEIDLGAGLDQPFSSATGKLARGEELLLLARTHHKLPEKVKVKGRAGGKDFQSEFKLDLEHGVATSLVPRLWAAEYARRLLGTGQSAEDNRSKVLDLGLEYGLMTPYTSFLALDSEGAYAQQGIRRRSTRLRGARLTSITNERQEKELGEMFAPTVPRSTMGCSKSEDAPASRSESASNKEGGTGTRAKGDEGSMSSMDKPSPASAPAAMPVATATAASEAPGDDLSAAAAPMAKAGGGPGSGGLVVGAHGAAAPGRGMAAGGACPPGDPLCSPGLQAKADGKSANTPPRDGPKKGKSYDEERVGIAAPRPIAPPPPEKDKDKKPPPPPPPLPIPPKRPLATCSDSASRPLAERIVLWTKRLKQARDPRELVNQYETARAACELPDWRDQSALLELLQARVQTEEAADVVLSHFNGEVEAQRYLARAILRRTVDARLSAAVSRVLFGGRVDWVKVDREVLDTAKPEDKLKHLREAMLQAPGDPSGDVRLVRLLAQTGNRQEALAYGRRLRDRGLETPPLAQQLGDVLSDSNAEDEARRTYSEIVEFDGENPASRRVLGDIFLRHRWYDDAYRQYKTLADLDAKAPQSWLRLAAAAAGAGRVDEALRIERQVATGEGIPGPDDPRQWARLWSAARLGALLSDPGTSGASPDAIGRKLKELSLFSGPGTLALLTWQDLESRLSLVTADDKKETLGGEAVDAGATGLVSLLTTSEAWQKNGWAARWRTDPRGRSVSYALIVLTWDGKAFNVSVKRGDLKPEDRQTSL